MNGKARMLVVNDVLDEAGLEWVETQDRRGKERRRLKAQRWRKRERWEEED